MSLPLQAHRQSLQVHSITLLLHIGTLVFLVLSCPGRLSYMPHTHPGPYEASQFLKQDLCLSSEQMGQGSPLSSWYLSNGRRLDLIFCLQKTSHEWLSGWNNVSSLEDFFAEKGEKDWTQKCPQKLESLSLRRWFLGWTPTAGEGGLETPGPGSA